jgi:glycosyltransferase involved in cell wall biosynthesis
MRSISIIVPTLNEDGNIGRLIERIHTTLFYQHISYEIIVVDDHSTDNTHMFIETIDTDFPNALQNARNDNKISYILVHDHTGLGTTDAINKIYPTMFDNGDHFAILVKDFGSWRLYKKI